MPLPRASRASANRQRWAGDRTLAHEARSVRRSQRSRATRTQRPSHELVGTRAERNAPVLVGLAVDRQPPLVAAAGLERERRDVDRERKVDRRSGLHAGGPAGLEPGFDEDGLLPPTGVHEDGPSAPRGAHGQGLSVAAERLEPARVLPVRLVPRHLDLDRERHRRRLGPGGRPAAAEDEELPLDRLSRVCEQDRDLHGCVTAASWPHAASMSRPRVSRTVAGSRASSSAPLKAAIAFRVEPAYMPVGLYGIRLTLKIFGSSSSASARACSTRSLIPPSITYSTKILRWCSSK